jgi:hypothetical protein
MELTEYLLPVALLLLAGNVVPLYLLFLWGGESEDSFLDRFWKKYLRKYFRGEAGLSPWEWRFNLLGRLLRLVQEVKRLFQSEFYK